MSPVTVLPVTNSASNTQTTTSAATATATTKVAATTTVLNLPENIKKIPTATTKANMANSYTTYKQMEQNKSASNNNNSNNNKSNIDVIATINLNKTKTQKQQHSKEMSSSASSTSSTSSSSFSSCSSSSSSSSANNKNVITSQCDSSSNSNNNSIKKECQQSFNAIIKTELESNDVLNKASSQNLNNAIEDPNDLQLSAMRHRPILLSTVNPHIICSLCFGYLIDATTIVECLHSFCHSCLIKHLRTEQYCPRCEMMINTAKPNIKPDTTLQAIVYKLVPGLYERELIRKRAFYKDRPHDAALATPEQRGDDTEHLIFSPTDDMSISLEYADIDEHMKTNTDYIELLKPRYLQCPAKCTVGHLKKLVYGKFEINSNRFTIDIMYKVKTIVLLDHYTLMDVAYIYTWKRDAPMRFYFRVKQSLRPLIRVKKNLMTQPKKEVAPPVVIEEPKLLTPVMCIVHEPTPSIVVSANSQKILEPAEIKQESEAEVSSTTEIVTPPLPEPKQFEIVQPQSQALSSQETSPTDKLKITLVNKAIKDKTNYSDNSSHGRVKALKERKENHKTTASTTSTPKDERKVENIKLKIDLSKQNSVTIINMSDPERKEIVKPVKPEKEWKVKTKKDKDSSPKSSPKSSPHNDRKIKTPSPLTVPPLTIKAERISPLAKTNATNLLEEDDKKSQFLKSFALAPIKSLKQDKLEAKSIKKEFIHTIVNKSLNNTKDPLHISSSSSKRKSKEPVKAIIKKPKLSPPLATEDFKIKLPSIANANSAINMSSTNKPLMPPPPPFTSMKPPSALPKKLQKPAQTKVTAAPPGSLTPHPMHGSSSGIQLAAPGSRTPIAKRFQPILPKTRINPFANIPSDVNKLLKDAGTEIKSIPKEPVSSKVYGPKSDTLPIMGPPTLPSLPSKGQSSANRGNGSSSGGSSKTGGGSKNNSYLNLALYNATKSKGNEVPPGCRTPMYTPNSPIYSPSSPQYVPNYNIPTMPTYKYTPKPSNNGSSYLQNVLGANSQLSSLFPSPPVKKDANHSHSNNNNSPNNSNSTNSNSNRNEVQPPKRVYPFARSPSPIEDPPEKQLKVKSLLNSCNINIPSSLSITITREDGETSSNGTAYPKQRSPVNNYIEILKIPDNSNETLESKRLSPPAQSASNSLFPNPPVRRVASPPPNKSQQSNNTTQNVSKPNTPASPKKSTAAAIQNLTTQNNNNNNSNNNLLGKQQNNTNKTSPVAANNKPQGTNQKSPINASDKKTPSPEKRLNPAANAEQKSPTGGSDSSASKKFRHILPRQIASANSQPEVNPVKSPNNGNVIGTYSSPSGLNVKIHSNKKAQPGKKSPGVTAVGTTNKQQQQQQQQQQQANMTNQNALKTTTKSQANPKNNNSNNKSNTPPAVNGNNNANKMSPITNMPALANALNHPMLPSQLAAACQNTAAGQAELSKFVKENLWRAQVQAAVANQSNMFYPYAANAAAAAAQFGQFNSMYNYQNYQQAYVMDQLTRMQRAGNEKVLSEYWQKLKNSMEANKPESLAQQQQQQPTHQQEKSSQNAKKLSSPKNLTGHNNSSSTSAASSATSNSSKDNNQTSKAK